MKKFYALLLTGALAFSLTACGGAKEQPAAAPAPAAKEEAPAAEEKPAEEAPAAPVETVKLRVAYMSNYASVWSVLTGIDKGYFAEEGLEIELTPFQDGPSEIAAMEGNSIDLAYIGHGAHKLCIQGKATIFAPSSVHSTDRIIVLPSAGVTSADDLANLKGKKVAYNAGSSSESALKGALKAAGLNADEPYPDIEAFAMDADGIVAAMASGQVDACTAWNPYSVQILNNSKGAKEIEFSTNSVNLSSWICLPKYAEENRDILVRFSRALYKAMDFSSKEENWDYAVGLYAKETAKDKEACLVETGDAHWFSSADIKSGIADNTMQDYYQKQQQMFIEAGAVEKEVPLEDYVLFDVMKEALGN